MDLFVEHVHNKFNKYALYFFLCELLNIAITVCMVSLTCSSHIDTDCILDPSHSRISPLSILRLRLLHLPLLQVSVRYTLMSCNPSLQGCLWRRGRSTPPSTRCARCSPRWPPVTTSGLAGWAGGSPARTPSASSPSTSSMTRSAPSIYLGTEPSLSLSLRCLPSFGSGTCSSS